MFGGGVTLPVGGYGFRDMEATYTGGAQRPLSGTVTVRLGEYFSGDIRTVGFSRGRVALTQQLSIEPTVSFNWHTMIERCLTRISACLTG